MADTPISSLPAAGVLTSTDLLVVVNGGVTRKAVASAIMPGSFGGSIPALAAGNAASPSLGWQGSPTTGLFSSGTGALDVTAGAVNTVRYSSTSTRFFVSTVFETGDVGVGVTPTSRNNTTLQIKDGVGFPSTQAASSDPNTLDDYEEGSWTPVIQFGGASVGVTYSTQSASYVKIGKVVHVQGRVTLSNKGSSTGNVVLAGLPFSVPAHGSINVGMTYATRSGDLVAYGSGTGFGLYQGAAGSGFINMTDAAFTNATDLIFFGHYEA